jgi:hypothetical protein
MLELLKQFHESAIVLPAKPVLRPDKLRLAERYERFVEAAG